MMATHATGSALTLLPPAILSARMQLNDYASWALLVGLAALIAYMSCRAGVSHGSEEQKAPTAAIQEGPAQDVRGDPEAPASKEATMQAEAPASNEATMQATTLKQGSRMVYLDNLKIVMTAVMMTFHIVGSFNGGGTNFSVGAYESSFTRFGHWFMDVNEAYFMALFFFISGFFTPGSFDKKGPFLFLQDKCKRLGLPAMMLYFVLQPLLLFVVIGVFFGQPEKYHYWYQNGPQWFILWLLIFNIAYAGFRRLQCKLDVASPLAVSLAMVAVSGFLGGLRSFVELEDGLPLYTLNCPHFDQLPQYAVAFAVGIGAKRHQWLRHLGNLSGSTLGLLGGLCLTYIAASFCWPQVITPPKPNPGDDVATELELDILRSIGVCTFSVLFSLALLCLFQRYLNKGGRIQKFFSEAAYPAYLIHFWSAEFFIWTWVLLYQAVVQEQLSFKVKTVCVLQLAGDCKYHRTENVTSFVQLESDAYLWLGCLYSVALTQLVTWPLAWALKQAPVLRDIV
mmetsp:Transcript_96383/g.249243  ORF Transcript_96383/g.249243 Transcript_96383/m.249243 type:complete len:510 (-) Transcript_96383:576-2105(-)